MKFRELSAIGVIPESHAQELIDLLRKLCGTRGQLFTVYEAVLRIGMKIPNEGRLMCYGGIEKNEWTFRQVGMPQRERDKQSLPASIKDVREVAVEENAFAFFTAMGYELMYEILRQGIFFVLPGKGDVRIHVAKLYKLEVQRDLSTAKLIDEETRIVEVTAVTDESYSEGMEAIEELAAQIGGLVKLSPAMPPPPTALSKGRRYP